MTSYKIIIGVIAVLLAGLTTLVLKMALTGPSDAARFRQGFFLELPHGVEMTSLTHKGYMGDRSIVVDLTGLTPELQSVLIEGWVPTTGFTAAFEPLACAEGPPRTFERTDPADKNGRAWLILSTCPDGRARAATFHEDVFHHDDWKVRESERFLWMISPLSS